MVTTFLSGFLRKLRGSGIFRDNLRSVPGPGTNSKNLGLSRRFRDRWSLWFNSSAYGDRVNAPISTYTHTAFPVHHRIHCVIKDLVLQLLYKMISVSLNPLFNKRLFEGHNSNLQKVQVFQKTTISARAEVLRARPVGKRTQSISRQSLKLTMWAM